MNLLRFGSFELDISKRRLSTSGNALHLGGRAFDILVALVTRPGQIISKQELIDAVWSDTTVDEGALRVHLVSLRKLLGDTDGARYIENVPGRGYIFVVPVEEGGSVEVPANGDRMGDAAAVLPPPRLAGRLVGRDDFVAQTAMALKSDRLVTICGTGGIGKTSAALAVAEIVGADVKVVFLDLSSVSDGRSLMPALGTLLGLMDRNGDPQLAVLQELSPQQLLLVLDNCEHLIEAAASAVEKILAAAPGVRIVATSREPLRVSNERIRQLPSLEVPPEGTRPENAIEYAAVQLFVDRVARSSDMEDLGATDNLDTVSSIVRRLDGIPLAIELAASRAASLGLVGLSESLDDPLTILRRGRRTAPPRQQTLRATLDWSYSSLSPDERTALECVSVFAGPFTADAAFAVGSEFSEDRFLEAFDGLFLKSLLSVTGGGGMYRLLETTRRYAIEKLEDSGRSSLRREAHAHYCETRLSTAEIDWKTLATPQWMQRYAPLANDVRAAIEWSMQEQGQENRGITLVARSHLLWAQLGLMAQQAEFLEWALTKISDSEHKSSKIEMELRIARGGTLYHIKGFKGDSEAAEEFSLAADIARNLGDTPKYVQAVIGATSIWTSNGEYAQSIRRALELRRELPQLPPHTFSRILDHTYFFSGDLAAALQEVGNSIENARGTVRLTSNSGVGYDQRIIALTVWSFIEFLEANNNDGFDKLDEVISEAGALDYAISSTLMLTLSACPMAYLADDHDRVAKYLAMAVGLVEKHALKRWELWTDAYQKIMLDGMSGIQLKVLLQDAVGLRFEYLTVLSGARAPIEAINRALEGEGGWCRPELLRLKAEFYRTTDSDYAVELLKQGLDLSRRMGARFWELRCAKSGYLIEPEIFPRALSHS